MSPNIFAARISASLDNALSFSIPGSDLFLPQPKQTKINFKVLSLGNRENTSQGFKLCEGEQTDTFEFYCFHFHYCLQIYFLNIIHSNGKPGYTCTCPTLWNYFETRNSKWVTEYLLSDKSDQKKTAKNDPHSQFVTLILL
jgi:hypothetical protein